MFRFPVLRQHTCEQLFARLTSVSEEDDLFSMISGSQSVSDTLDFMVETRWSFIEDEELQVAVAKVADGFGLES